MSAEPVTPEERERRILLWADGLLSGRWLQGRGTLRTTRDRYCCLGVACEIFREQTGLGEWVPFYIDGELAGWKFAVADRYGVTLAVDGTIPGPVAEWLLGCEDDADPFVDDPEARERSNLSTMNDAGGTFGLIAALVKDQLVERYTAPEVES